MVWFPDVREFFYPKIAMAFIFQIDFIRLYAHFMRGDFFPQAHNLELLLWKGIYGAKHMLVFNTLTCYFRSQSRHPKGGGKGKLFVCCINTYLFLCVKLEENFIFSFELACSINECCSFYFDVIASTTNRHKLIIIVMSVKG